MYDDSADIYSPGEMVDGTRIQDLDIENYDLHGNTTQDNTQATVQDERTNELLK